MVIVEFFPRYRKDFAGQAGGTLVGAVGEVQQQLVDLLQPYHFGRGAVFLEEQIENEASIAHQLLNALDGVFVAGPAKILSVALAPEASGSPVIRRTRFSSWISSYLSWTSLRVR